MRAFASVVLCALVAYPAPGPARAGEGDGVAFARVTLRDVQGLWGGQDLWLDADGKLVVQTVHMADRLKGTKRFTTQLSAEQVAAAVKLLADRKFLEIRIPPRPGVPDEARPTITLRTSDGREASVAKWANDKHPDFDAIYKHLLDLVKEAVKGEPSYVGPYNRAWQPPLGGADPKAARRAEERAEQLKAAIKSFTLTLSYYGPQDKPYYWLFLSVPPIPPTKSTAFHLKSPLTEDEAQQLIAYLATDGFLERAEDLSGNPARPIREGSGYVLTVRVEPKEGAFFTLSEDLGWGLEMLRRLDALRKVLPARSAGLMDTLLARLEGHRREWGR